MGLWFNGSFYKSFPSLEEIRKDCFRLILLLQAAANLTKLLLFYQVLDQVCSTSTRQDSRQIYMPVCLDSVPSKIRKRIILGNIETHLKDVQTGG